MCRSLPQMHEEVTFSTTSPASVTRGAATTPTLMSFAPCHCTACMRRLSSFLDTTVAVGASAREEEGRLVRAAAVQGARQPSRSTFAPGHHGPSNGLHDVPGSVNRAEGL